MPSFQSILKDHQLRVPCRDELQTLQVNMGRLCNMNCTHCHINASPFAKEVMTDETADSIIRFLFKNRIGALDITGGAPEMAPSFRNLVTRASQLVKEVIVRCNLTVLFEPGMESLPEFYVINKVHLVCSLPCYTMENVDKQRGEGTFEKSIKALKLLNERGYGYDNVFKIDLVYNPGGAFLPTSQAKLEADYKRALEEEHGIVFNKLITITNMPINRFGKEIKKNDSKASYLRLLAENFNPSALKRVMCKNLLSVGWNGKIYDCDFNQALGMETRDSRGNTFTINNLDPRKLEGEFIRCGDHCLGCVAGEGSSCTGTLV